MTCSTHSSDDNDDAMVGTPVGCIGRTREGISLKRSEGKSEADCVGDDVRRIEGGIVGKMASTGVGWLVSKVGAVAIGEPVRVNDSGDMVGSEENATTGLNVGRIVGVVSVRSVGATVGGSIGCTTGIGCREGNTVGMLNARPVRYRSQSSRSSSAMGKPFERLPSSSRRLKKASNLIMSFFGQYVHNCVFASCNIETRTRKRILWEASLFE